MSQLAADYWHSRYTLVEGRNHHSQQNGQISRDFLAQARLRPKFTRALGVDSIIEIGCGTGELSAMLDEFYRPSVVWGTDFVRAAIFEADKRHPNILFKKFDILKDMIDRRFDLAISSNTLEHFSNFITVIENMLRLSPTVILIVPYRQRGKDRYDAEGGAGHVTSFSLATFSDFKIIDHFKFETEGWTWSGKGEPPLQLAVILEKLL